MYSYSIKIIEMENVIQTIVKQVSMLIDYYATYPSLKSKLSHKDLYIHGSNCSP